MKILKRLSISLFGGSDIRRLHVKRQLRMDGVPTNRLPDIRMVITDYYRGAINDVIYMIVRDVDHVMVCILSAEGKEVEKGPATNSSGVWSYRTGVANPTFPGGRVVVSGRNIRGDQVEMGITVF